MPREIMLVRTSRFWISTRRSSRPSSILTLFSSTNLLQTISKRFMRYVHVENHHFFLRCFFFEVPRFFTFVCDARRTLLLNAALKHRIPTIVRIRFWCAHDSLSSLFSILFILAFFSILFYSFSCAASWMALSCESSCPDFVPSPTSLP